MARGDKNYCVSGRSVVEGTLAMKPTEPKTRRLSQGVRRATEDEPVTECETLAESVAVYVDACALAKISFEEPGSTLVRCLIYMSTIPAYCSMVGLGEFVAVAGKKKAVTKK